MDSKDELHIENKVSDSSASVETKAVSPWRIVSWVCGTVILVSVFSCIVMAVLRSEGLREIKVTALDAELEPRDHSLPLIKKFDALPDYEILVRTEGLFRTNLGAKPNKSAQEGLTWRLKELIPVSEITSICLQDQDKVISDALVEVQITGPSVVAGNYRFDFQTEHSAELGVKSFFKTPVGQAISIAFTISIIIVLLRFFSFFFI
ncbi:hypothetical protein Pan241w_43250 [Gimesia alba]|uniref:Uncharacterized protein n=1 Tax=Gimesia alba TaxID=2527973 RepID=A0A517RK05_9PLAN|nr:hypothetical protein Pan241w_43250 [Gimesia alba]